MENLDKIKEMFDKDVDRIYQNNNQVIIRFKDGTEIPLIGPQNEVPINVPHCNFCGSPGGDDHPLFTTNNEHFICPECVSLSVKTFLQNDVDIAIELGEKFGELGEQITLFEEANKTFI